MKQSGQLDYIGRKPCGCVMCWMSSDLPAKEIAKEVARLLRCGWSIERMTTEQAKAALVAGLDCEHDGKKETIIQQSQESLDFGDKP